jgi:hypothetical protein
MRTRTVTEEHYTVCQHSTPLFSMALRSFFVFRSTLSDVTVVLCCINSTISTLSCPSKQLLHLSGSETFSTCLMSVCPSTALTTLSFQHSHMKPGFHQLLLVQYYWGIHCHICGIILKKPNPFSAFCKHPSTFLEFIVCKTCVSLV